jgi:hypothetical protein
MEDSIDKEDRGSQRRTDHPALDDRAAMAIDGMMKACVVARQDAPHRLRVLLPQLGATPNIRE